MVSRICIFGCEGFGQAAIAWAQIGERLRVGKEDVDVFALTMRESQHQDRSAAESPKWGLTGAFLEIVDQ